MINILMPLPEANVVALALCLHCLTSLEKFVQNIRLCISNQVPYEHIFCHNSFPF